MGPQRDLGTGAGQGIKHIVNLQVLHHATSILQNYLHQVRLVASTEKAKGPLKFILRNCNPQKLLVKAISTESEIMFKLSTSRMMSMNFCALVRLMTSMQDRDLSDLSPMLYACGFPCKPCLVPINQNHSAINPLLPSPTYFRELSEIFAFAAQFKADERSGSSAVLGQSGSNSEEILECDYTMHPTLL